MNKNKSKFGIALITILIVTAAVMLTIITYRSVLKKSGITISPAVSTETLATEDASTEIAESTENVQEEQSTEKTADSLPYDTSGSVQIDNVIADKGISDDDPYKDRYEDAYIAEQTLQGLPFPAELAFSERVEFGEGIFSLYYSVKNTDAICVAMAYPNEEPMIDGPTNKYGSGYPIIYFTNGVPENSQEIYLYFIINELPGSMFTSDYVSGDTAVLTDTDTGEQVTVQLQ